MTSSRSRSGSRRAASGRSLATTAETDRKGQPSKLTVIAKVTDAWRCREIIRIVQRTSEIRPALSRKNGENGTKLLDKIDIT
jgi:hypothetical protein